MVLVDFSQLNAAKDWFAVNDTLMGGVSRSRMAVSPLGFGVFSGHVSLANGGGFASVRYDFDSLDLSDFAGIVLDVNGSTKRFKVNIKDSLLPDSCVYQAEFDMADFVDDTDDGHKAYGTWHKVMLPFDDFIAKRRGIGLQNHQLNLTQVQSLGLVIGGGQAGDFSLNVRSIATIKG